MADLRQDHIDEALAQSTLAPALRGAFEPLRMPLVRSVLAVLMAIDLKTLEEGAASLGAGFWERFRDIVLPNCRQGILAGSLMVVTLSMGEFNMTWLLHTPFTKTLPVGLADAYASLRLEVGSAYTLVFFVMIMPLLLAMQAFAKPRPVKFVAEETE